MTMIGDLMLGQWLWPYSGREWISTSHGKRVLHKRVHTTGASNNSKMTSVLNCLDFCFSTVFT